MKAFTHPSVLGGLQLLFSNRYRIVFCKNSRFKIPRTFAAENSLVAQPVTPARHRQHQQHQHQHQQQHQHQHQHQHVLAPTQYRWRCGCMRATRKQSSCGEPETRHRASNNFVSNRQLILISKHLLQTTCSSATCHLQLSLYAFCYSASAPSHPPLFPWFPRAPPSADAIPLQPVLIAAITVPHTPHFSLTKNLTPHSQESTKRNASSVDAAGRPPSSPRHLTLLGASHKASRLPAAPPPLRAAATAPALMTRASAIQATRRAPRPALMTAASGPTAT